jgi:cell division septation protein DedD
VLAVCALLLMLGVFALGLVVGKRLSSAAQPPRVDELTALDEAQAAAVARPLKPAAPIKPVAKPAAEPASRAKDETKPVAPKPLADADEEQPVPEQGKPPVEAPAPAVLAERTERPDRPAPKPAAVVPAPKEPVVVPQAAKPAVIKQPNPVAPSPLPRELGQFTVQLGASQDRTEAQKLESRARGAGLKPYVVEAQLGAKGTWYRVRVGAFGDKDSANQFRKDVERELRTSAVVMPTH